MPRKGRFRGYSLRLDERTRHALEMEAEKRGLSLSAALRMILRRYARRA